MVAWSAVVVATGRGATGSAEVITGARVALAGVADRVRFADPELPAGVTCADADFDAAGAAIADRLEPATDVHASGEYRRRLARVLVARALREARARAAGEAA